MESIHKYYTGVGARKSPKKILDVMTDLAIKMNSIGYILRSGGAEGADKAFESGAINKHIYYASDATEFAMSMAGQLHPAWERLSLYAKKLHGRNVFQVLGRGMDIPSEVLICWTADGCISHKERTIKTGGTATAISLASTYGVPVYNLKRKDHLEVVLKWIK